MGPASVLLPKLAEEMDALAQEQRDAIETQQNSVCRAALQLEACF